MYEGLCLREPGQFLFDAMPRAQKEAISGPAMTQHAVRIQMQCAMCQTSFRRKSTELRTVLNFLTRQYSQLIFLSMYASITCERVQCLQ